jgi:hypothetical protein
MWISKNQLIRHIDGLFGTIENTNYRLAELEDRVYDIEHKPKAPAKPRASSKVKAKPVEPAEEADS